MVVAVAVVVVVVLFLLLLAPYGKDLSAAKGKV